MRSPGRRAAISIHLARRHRAPSISSVLLLRRQRARQNVNDDSSAKGAATVRRISPRAGIRKTLRWINRGIRLTCFEHNAVVCEESKADATADEIIDRPHCHPSHSAKSAEKPIRAKVLARLFPGAAMSMNVKVSSRNIYVRNARGCCPLCNLMQQGGVATVPLPWDQLTAPWEDDEGGRLVLIEEYV